METVIAGYPVRLIRLPREIELYVLDPDDKHRVLTTLTIGIQDIRNLADLLDHYFLELMEKA